MFGRGTAASGYMVHNGCCNDENWFKYLAALIGFAVIVVLIISFIVFGDARATTNYGVFASKDFVPVTATSDPDGFAQGQIKMNQNQKTVEWDLVYDRLAAVISIKIYGPIGETSTEIGPLAIALCGPPSSLSCDVSVPRRVKGKIDHKMPGHKSLRQTITTLREHWAFYKVCLATTEYPDFAVCSPLFPG